MKYAFLFLINIFSFNLIFGQVQSSSGLLGGYGTPSPEAASLGKYIDHPVGLYTGTPIINIPLFEIVSGRIKVPISLSYHASGVKVGEISSRVGTGFSLNAGGVVSTVVKGLPDESPAGLFAEKFLQGIEAGFAGYDMEPDVHYYKFGAKQGKIYFQDKATPFTIDNDPIKIVGPYGADKKFILTTEDGIIYKFEAVEKNRQTIVSTTSLTSIVSHSYYLTEIEDPVSSRRVKFIYRTDMPGSIEYSLNRYWGASMLNCHLASTPLIGNAVFLEEPKVLQKIEYAGGFIEFKADHNRQDLVGDRAYTEINQYVEAYGNTAPLLKKGFNLSYAYTANGTSVEGKRLYLESVKEKGTDGTFLPPYTFSYKNREALPPRNSQEQDVWGFYNANGASSMDYPKVYVYNSSGKCSYLPIKVEGWPSSKIVPGIDRSSNPLTIDYGVLNKIVYPTKGYTTYDYEPHIFGYNANYGIYNFTAVFKQGGIRVKEIKDFSANGELLLNKSYSYFSGHLGGPLPQAAVPTYFQNSYFQFSQNQSLLGTCQGSYVGYGMVDEVVKEPSNKRSATFYYYSQDPDVEGNVYVYENGCSDFTNLTEIMRDTFFPFFAMESREARRGLLLKQEFFSDYQMVQEEQPIKRIEYTYNLWSRLMHSATSVYVTGNESVKLWGSRDLNQEKMLLTSKIETDYVPTGDSIKRQTNYGYTSGVYDGQFLRSETIHTQVETSLDQEMEVRYKYPFDYAVTASGGVMGKMVAMNYINPVISEIKKTTENPSGSGPISYYTDAKITNYFEFYSHPTTKPIQIKEVFQLKSGSVIMANSNNYPLVDVVDPSNPGSKYEKRLEYKYNIYQSNPSSITSDYTTVSLDWDLGGARDLLAYKRESSKNSEAFFLPPQGWTAVYDSDAITKDVSYVYTGYDVPFPILMTGLGPTIISFWAKGGTFSLETAGGNYYEVAPSNWKYYSFKIPGNIEQRDGEVYLKGTARLGEVSMILDDAAITHYGYDTLDRLQYTISPAGKIEHYEYDPFSRLKNVKDQNGHIIKSYDYNYKP